MIRVSACRLRQRCEKVFQTNFQAYTPLSPEGLPKCCPTASIYTPWTEADVLSHLATGWGEGAITELRLEYLYGPEPEVSGE